ncbi:MAG: transcriptional regulator [Gammaproteobacteria bacterium]|nr:transcriptional regulator [Gammaproteobacteria bacterium]
MNATLNKIAPAWKAIEQATRLGPIKNKAHYHEIVVLSDALIGEIGGNAAHPLVSLLYIVGDLIRDYDEKHYAIPDASPAGIVAFLMEQHGLRQSDLPEIGTQGVVSEVLSGKRALNARQIKRLAERFGVAAGAFL